MTNWADDIQDYEYPEPDTEDDDTTEMIVCPECHDSIYGESVRCPSCGFFLTDASRRFRDRPAWWKWVIALIIISFVATYLIF